MADPMSVYSGDDLVALHLGLAEPGTVGQRGLCCHGPALVPAAGCRGSAEPWRPMPVLWRQHRPATADDGTLWLVLGGVYTCGNPPSGSLAGWSATKGLQQLGNVPRVVFATHALVALALAKQPRTGPVSNKRFVQQATSSRGPFPERLRNNGSLHQCAQRL